MKLDIGGRGPVGSAERRGEDYLTVSLDRGGPSERGSQLVADMGTLPFRDNSIDAIWSSHALEHVPMARVIPILKEWLRVIKPGRRLILQVPNFDYIAKYWLTGPGREWAERMVFGEQANEHDFHRCAFTGTVLKTDLAGAGWQVRRVELRWNHDQETLQAVAVKPTSEAIAP